MFNDVEFVTTEDIKEITSINTNVDPSQLEPYISVAEEKHVNDVLGVALITEIKNQITGNTLSDSNIVLLEQYIKPAVVWASWLEASTFLRFKTVAKGVVKQSSSFSESITQEEFSDFKNQIKSNVQHYLKRLKLYLDNHKEQYPLYRSTCNNVTNNYNNGIYLGRSL